MSLLPSSPDISPDSEPRVVGLDSEEADDLMAALSSTMARRLLSELHDEPAPPGELADRVDTSLQNAQYHLEKLEDAGAVEVVGTAYSEKGREMNVYGPSDSPLVIFAGEQERASGLRAALSRLFAGWLALAVAALGIQELFGESLFRATDDVADDAPAEATPTPTPEPTPVPEEELDDIGTAAETTPTPEGTPTPAPEDDAATPTPTELPMETPGPGDGFGFIEGLETLFGAGLPPGVAFFLGGATVLSIVVALTYLRTP